MAEEQQASEIEPGAFRHVLGHFPTGVTVVTGIKDGRPAGLAIGSFFSVSLDPPLVGFCVGKNSGSWGPIDESGAFCVNIMTEKQGQLTGMMASKAEDKFADVDWTPAGTGSPRLPGCIGFIDCTIESRLDGGDHLIIIGRVQGLDVESEDGPLLFFKGGYGGFAGAS